jgi:transposase-like protein
MAKTRPPYTPEFRRQMVELVRAGRSPEELEREFEPTAQSIKNWVGQAERDAGRAYRCGAFEAARIAVHRSNIRNPHPEYET